MKSMFILLSFIIFADGSYAMKPSLTWEIEGAEAVPVSLHEMKFDIEYPVHSDEGVTVKFSHPSKKEYFYTIKHRGVSYLKPIMPGGSYGHRIVLSNVTIVLTVSVVEISKKKKLRKRISRS